MIYVRVSHSLTAVVDNDMLPGKVGVSVMPLYHLRHKIVKRVWKLMVCLTFWSRNFTFKF